MEHLFTGELFGIIAPVLIMINAVLMLTADIISNRKEKTEKTEMEEIKEKWKGGS